MKLRINDFEIEEQGTVRAALALGGMSVAAYALLTGVAQPEWLIAFMAAIAYYYFEKRDVEIQSAEPAIDGDLQVSFRR